MSEQVLLAGCGDLGLRVARCLRARGDQVWALRRQPPSMRGCELLNLPGRPRMAGRGSVTQVTDSRERVRACAGRAIEDSHRKWFSSKAPGGEGIEWLQADLTRPDSLQALPPGITQVVYLPTPDRRDPGAYRATFVDGLRHLLAALDGSSLRRVLFVSSSAVYGEHAGNWVDEDTPATPPGFNGATLLEAEQLLAMQPVRSVVLRLAGLYGPARLQLLDRLRAGSAPAPRRTPHWANRIHVDDAAAAIAHLLQLPDPAPLYLGVDNTPLPLAVLYDHLAELIDAPRPLDGPPPAGIGSKRLSNARLLASGFVPRWPDARAGYAALI